MPDIPARDASVEELVSRFTKIALAQHDAIWKFQTARYNRLYDQMAKVKEELKSRDGDQRRALIPLLESSDIHVRMKAATALLAIVPELAQKALETVRDFGQLPQSADAAMMLMSVNDGSYIPD